MAQQRTRIGHVFGSLVMLALAAGVLALAWSMVEEELRFLAGSRIVSGEVVDHVYLRSESSRPRRDGSPGGYYDLARFVDEAGNVHQVQSRSGSGWAPNDPKGQTALQQKTGARPLGATVRVAYPPGQPEQARMLGFGDQYLLPLITSAIGLMLLLFSLLIWRDRREPPPAQEGGAS